MNAAIVAIGYNVDDEQRGEIDFIIDHWLVHGRMVQAIELNCLKMFDSMANHPGNSYNHAILSITPTRSEIDDTGEPILLGRMKH